MVRNKHEGSLRTQEKGKEAAVPAWQSSVLFTVEFIFLFSLCNFLR